MFEMTLKCLNPIVIRFRRKTNFFRQSNSFFSYLTAVKNNVNNNDVLTYVTGKAQNVRDNSLYSR